MITTADELARELRSRGMAAGEPANADPGNRATDRPWYIGLLLGAAGWVAGLFLLPFLFMLFEPKSGAAALLMGAVLLAAGWGLFRVDRDGAFVSQLALAISIAGQFAVLYGVHESFFKGSHSIAGIAFTALVIQLALIAAMPNRLHRTMSTLFACVAWAVFVRYGLWDKPGWDSGHRSSEEPPLGMALLGWAIVWLPVGGVLYALIRKEPAWMASGRQTLVRPITIGLIAGLATATLLSHPFDSFSWGITQPRANWLALWPMLSAFASLGALAAAFALGSRGLMAICVVAALLHISHFYYAMGTTLLVKSVTMLVLGALLLAVAWYLKRPKPA